MPEMITCTRYGAPCKMSKKACRKRWELSQKPTWGWIDLSPCRGCPVHEQPIKQKAVRRRNRDSPTKKRLEATLKGLGYESLKAGLEDAYRTMTIKQIGLKYGLSAKAVFRYFQSEDIETRHQGISPRENIKIMVQK
jgi:hypothetical protein